MKEGVGAIAMERLAAADSQCREEGVLAWCGSVAGGRGLHIAGRRRAPGTPQRRAHGRALGKEASLEWGSCHVYINMTGANPLYLHHSGVITKRVPVAFPMENVAQFTQAAPDYKGAWKTGKPASHSPRRCYRGDRTPQGPVKSDEGRPCPGGAVEGRWREFPFLLKAGMKN